MYQVECKQAFPKQASEMAEEKDKPSQDKAETEKWEVIEEKKAQSKAPISQKVFTKLDDDYSESDIVYQKSIAAKEI